MDGVRGIAVLMVLIYHHWGFAGFPALPLGGFALSGLLHYGFLGVHVFFILSGLVLAWPYCGPAGKSLDQLSLSSFLRRRFTRLAPPYYVILSLSALPIFAVAFLKADGIPPRLWLDLLAHLLWLHNLHSDWLASFNIPLWTLALQFQLYLLFPLFLWLLQRIGLFSFTVTVLLAGLLYRLAVWPLMSADDWPLNYSVAYALPGRMFEFAAGISLASLVRDRPDLLTGRGTRLAAVLLCFVSGSLAFIASQRHGDYYPPVDILWALAIASGLFLTFALPGWQKFLTCRPLVFCGLCSYSLFLVHHPFGLWLHHHFYFEETVSASVRLAVMWLYLPLMIAVGWLCWRWLERPFLIPKNP